MMLAGHGADAVTWLSNTMDGWITSPVYSETPVPAVKAFLDANPIAADFGKTWNRGPAETFPWPDDAVGEAPPQGWTRTFPHVAERRGQPAGRRLLRRMGAQPVCRRATSAASRRRS